MGLERGKETRIKDGYRQHRQHKPAQSPRVWYEISSNGASIPTTMHGYVVLVVLVLALTHGYNAVRGHRTGSNNSGAEDYLRRKTNKKS